MSDQVVSMDSDVIGNMATRGMIWYPPKSRQKEGVLDIIGKKLNNSREISMVSYSIGISNYVLYMREKIGS